MERKIKLLSIFFIVLSLPAVISGRDIENSFDYWKNYKFVDNLPERYNQQILIISNRTFEEGTNNIYYKGVDPQRELSYLVVSRVADSSYIVRYNSFEEAMGGFKKSEEYLLFINGHGKSFGHIIGRGFEIGKRFNVGMIMYDWPTNYYAIRKTIANARKVTANFAVTLNELSEVFDIHYPQAEISVIFHSMGNRIIKRIVEKEYLAEIPEDIFQNLVLNAAAVKQKNHAEWVEKLDLSERVYITSNDGDFPLKGVKLLRLATQLGSEYEKPLAENATYIDFSDIADKEHNIFLGRTELEIKHPEIYDIYLSLFTGSNVDMLQKQHLANHGPQIRVKEAL